MRQYTVAIVEDDPSTLRFIEQTVLQMPELAIVGTAADFAGGTHLLSACAPDILLTDLGLPDGSGVDLIRQACRLNAHCLALVLSGLGDEQNVISSIMSGAKGYLLKHDESQEIARGIRQLIDGGSPISASIARYLLVNLQDKPPAPHAPIPSLLTSRESQVLELIALGYRNNEIAGQLSISYHTVVNHVRNVYDKLAVSSRSQAIHKASQIGLLRPVNG